ncbi:MAG: hypothetical protein M1812_001665 [Candelaria pacifica]|nr:MAG: hypothetical protein M1812_001665 [Candelaria pacifica]
MDDATFQLVIDIQLQNIDEFLANSKGKAVEGKQNDAEAALLIHRDELLAQASILSDRRMGRSIGQAVEDDARIIAEVRLENYQATRDKELAYRLSGLAMPVNTSPEPQVDEATMSRLEVLNTWTDYGDDIEAEEVELTSSSRTRSNSQLSKLTGTLCVSCRERKPTFDILEAPCEHTYCRECIIELFKTSIDDETLFPPRCCRQIITLSSVRDFFDTAFIKIFEMKAIEFGTADRTYCAQRSCATFIPPRQIHGDLAVCSSCQQSTCTMCKGVEHKAGDCPKDMMTQRLLETARENRWQRCHVYVLAVLNFVTNAAVSGDHVAVNMRTRYKFSIKVTKSLLRTLKRILNPRLRMPYQLKIATKCVGYVLMERIVARLVTIYLISSSSDAFAARCELVVDVEEIDCDDI